MKSPRLFVLIFSLLAAGASAASLTELFNERLKSVVAVEFTVQTEIERQPVTVWATVIDRQGTVIASAQAISPAVSLDQLRDFKVYRPNSTESFPAAYLGQDQFTGWHFFRVDAKLIPELVPITQYGAAQPEAGLTDELWGIGLRNKDEDFQPYFLQSRVAIIMKLPQKTAILGSEVAGPGLPVFNAAGQFAGLAQPSFGQNYLLYSQRQRGNPILLVNIEESSVVQLADEVLPYLGRIPASVSGRPMSYFGAYGLQPVDPEVAKLLKLENQSGAVLSDIVRGSPADLAGLKERDILLAIDGQPFPRLRPDRIIVGWFTQEIMRRKPGDVVTLTVLRGTARQDVRVTLGDEPKLPREADRKYFDRLGLTIREFVHADSLMHRAESSIGIGAAVQFVKPGSPVATAGLRPDDWIREIDGEEMKTFVQAVEKLQRIEADKSRAELVLLVSRGGETSVLRVKLN